MKKFTNFLVMTLSLFFLFSNVYSIDMPKVPKVGIGGGGDKADIDVDALVDQQSALVGSMAAALSNLLTANMNFLEAVGKKGEAEKLKKTIDGLKAGKDVEKDNLEAGFEAADTSTKTAIGSFESVKLDAEGKAKFAQGIPPYAAGTIDMTKTGFAAVDTFKSLKGTKDLTILRKLGKLIFIGKNAPSLISSFADATKKIKKFTSSQGIKDDKLLELKPDMFSAPS